VNLIRQFGQYQKIRREEKMKAAVFYGIEDIRIEDFKEPTCNENEVKIKVHYCAICGTDVRIYFSGHKKVNPPAIIGHEITGEIVEIGRNVNYPEIKVGDRITLVTSIGCKKCKMCQKGYYNLCPDTKAIGYYYQGGYAEYLVVPEEAVKQKVILKLPDNVSLIEGTLIEPLSCCINGQKYLNINDGDNVVIFGGGPIGFMHSVLAKAQGGSKVIIVDPAYERLEKFGKSFPDIILLDGKSNFKEKIMQITDNVGPDVVITACPSKQAQIDGIELLAEKGRISFFGGLPKDDSRITIDSNTIHYKELSVFGSFASNREDYITALNLISEGKIDAKKFITMTLPLEKITDGIKAVRKGEVLKCVIEING